MLFSLSDQFSEVIHKVKLGAFYLYKYIILRAGTSIVLPVGYMDQPTGLLHIYLWRRLCGRQGRRYSDALLTRLSGYVNFEFLKVTAPIVDALMRRLCLRPRRF